MFRKDQKPRTHLRPLAGAARPLPEVPPTSLTDDELRQAGGAMINSAPGTLDNGTHTWTEPSGTNGLYTRDPD